MLAHSHGNRPRPSLPPELECHSGPAPLRSWGTQEATQKLWTLPLSERSLLDSTGRGELREGKHRQRGMVRTVVWPTGATVILLKIVL